MEIGYANGRHLITKITQSEYDEITNAIKDNVFPVKIANVEEILKKKFSSSLVLNNGIIYIKTRFNELQPPEYLARYLVMALDNNSKYLKIV